jgi:hypothetical protein
MGEPSLPLNGPAPDGPMIVLGRGERRAVAVMTPTGEIVYTASCHNMVSSP